MTAISEFGIEQVDGGTARISWTGTPDHFTHVFINGFPVTPTPVKIEVADKSLNVPVDVTRVFAVEIIENVDGTPVGSSIVERDYRPIIHWSQSAFATHYRIFHTPDGEVEREIAILNDDPDVKYYSHDVDVDLESDGGRWHFFRVEAFNENTGEQSTTASFFFFYLWDAVKAIGGEFGR